MLKNNKTQIFGDEVLGAVRTMAINGEPWFVASDVCKALELGNPSMTVERLDDDEKGISTIDTLGGKQRMAIINEPGLYSLVITSRKPEAKAFKRWITHEVTLTTNEGHSGKLGGAQMLNVISEAGLYSLILKSRKPEAKAFKRERSSFRLIDNWSSFLPTIAIYCSYYKNGVKITKYNKQYDF